MKTKLLAVLILALAAPSAQAQVRVKKKRRTRRTVSSASRLPIPRNAAKKAPKVFTVVFETTKGEFELEVRRKWSPLGADRLYNLVRLGFYKDIAFFRAIKGFMVQFGIHGDPGISSQWVPARMPDDPTGKATNTRGTLSFAMAGPNTRTTQMFINTVNNSRLDSMGFTPVGRVVKGMSVVDRLHTGYGEGSPMGRGPDQGRIQREGNAYLKSKFPKLDYILSARVKGEAPARVARKASKPKRAPRPKAPADLRATVSFSEPSGNNILDAGEDGTLTVKIINKGKGTAYDVRVKPRSNRRAPWLSLPSERSAGTIKPGKSKSVQLYFNGGLKLPTTTAEIKVEVLEANGFDADPVLIRFPTLEFKKPKLAVSEVVIGGSGVVKKGEMTELSVTVTNEGEGEARKAAAKLDLGSPDIFPGGDTVLSLGILKPGESKKASFQFFINKRYKGGKTLPISLTLTAAKGGGTRKRPLRLALGETAPSLRTVVVKGREPARRVVRDEGPENVDDPPRSRTRRNKDAYAVVIGIEKYRDVPGVDFASRDAETMKRYLTRAMGYDERNVILLQNQRATKTDLEKYLGRWLRNQVSKKSRVFIYYAGHGAPNPATGKGFLIPYDGDPSYTEDTAYPIDKLFGTLAKLPTRDVTVVLDACFSGAGGRSVLAKGARPLVMSVKKAPVGRNTVLLTASSGDQISTYFPEARHGLLTYYLLKGLRGAADADKNKRVTTRELFDYVRPHVEREARRKNVAQTPTLHIPGAGKGEDRKVWIRLR